MPLLTPDFFKQGRDEALAHLPRYDDGPMQVSFTHLLHAYVDEAVPANTAVQFVTFESIRAAEKMSASTVATSCVAVTFADEAQLCPADCIAVPALSRVVTDVATFAEARRLPLLFDILDIGIAADDGLKKTTADTDYIVFTNSDIHLQPYFYVAVAELIRIGYDVITINRRTIDRHPGGNASLALMYSDYGTDHPGFDCFVFPRHLYARFTKSEACIGAGMVMRSLLFNLAAHGRRFLMLTAAHLTFHIGDDRYWSHRRFQDYIAFNAQQAHRVAVALAGNRVQAEKLAAFMRANGENPQTLKAVEDIAGITGSPRR